MPTYDYRCGECDIITEVFHRMGEEKTFSCSNCKKIMVKQISGGTGFLLKGEGWDKKPSLPENDE